MSWVKIAGWVWRSLVTLLAAWILWNACVEFFNIAWGEGTWLGQFSAKLGPAFFVLALACGVIFIAIILSLWWPAKIRPLFQRFAKYRDRLGWWRWLFLAAFLAYLMWLAQYSYWGGVLTGTHLRLLLLLSLISVSGALITRDQEQLIRLPDLATGALLVAAVFYLGGNFTWVDRYPFSHSWSEGNRIWDYSALFGRRLYKYPPDQPIFAFIDLGRQSLWGLPFLIPGITIQGMRLWDALVITIPYAMLGWIALQRFRSHTTLWLLGGVWAFVFLSQGPIYTPLVISAILVAIAWRRPLWLALPLIALAGYYAQLARFTWMFAPALWAGMIYFADKPLESKATSWRVWALTAAAVLAGLAGGVLIPKMITGSASLAIPVTDTFIEREIGASEELISVSGLTHAVTRQPLLWDRLLPNPTFYPGILLGLILASVPLVLLLVHLVRSRRWPLDWLRGAAVVVILLLFLGVGLVVSVKIGGGSNLHNLDMFLIGLVFAAALAWRAGGFQTLVNLGEEKLWVQWLVVVMMGIYAYPPVLGARPLTLPSQDKVEKALTTIQEEVQNASLQGEVLFMDQRQLLTFGYVPNIPLVPDYEKKYLMDNALSDNQALFEKFYKDLAQQRFSLIISEPLRARTREGEHHFRDENNAWVKWVSAPILCYYKPLVTFREVKVQLLEPRRGTTHCPELPIPLP